MFVYILYWNYATALLLHWVTFLFCIQTVVAINTVGICLLFDIRLNEGIYA